MKVLERIVLAHLVSQVKPALDPLQFVYQPHVGVNNAVTYLLQCAHSYLDGSGARKTIPPPNDQVLCLSTADMKRTLCTVNPRKSAGPDNIPGRVLRECAEQLADVFTDIFNISLSSAIVPTCLETMTIVPLPKKSTVSCLNDYRPIALTHIVMKCFERLVMRHIKTQLLPSLDPLQFAYHPNHSMDDAITTTLHLSLTHLDNKDTYKDAYTTAAHRLQYSIQHNHPSAPN
ncbi:hypothetical protein QTP70_031810 [Hemibagrus guttatus]|uniref:Reverse transcriptase domain-containing protein n=1 Tax=Hemibagrus guttatus TaxID=175788 RepID=A0AAE0PUW7_9TELE|nr:hypothetical protein QTP70_031810 [Hemibagrus guttatus]